MAMKFSGDFVVKKSREEVYDFLTDPQRFAPLLPDYQGMSMQDPQNFTVNVKVGVSYIKGTAEVKMNLDKGDRPTFALYKGQGKLPGGSANVSAGFDLAETAEGTKVAWTGEAQVFGKLTSLAGGLLEPMAKKNVQKLIDGLKAALS
ncbi:MAG TPA: SRPBCC domain-containing protein [Terriglobales bacterium]|nr:SRPBCC domain-containing protein [Terriglobales bacterium]